jgi:hypothetical protein
MAADDGMNSGIIYGTGHTFVLTAPPGWVLDNQSGAQQGLYAVFYPKGSSWKGSKAVMYANTTLKEKGETLESFMKFDEANYRDNYKTKKMEDAAPLAIANGRKVPVKYFLGDQNGNYEAVAYVDEKTIVAFLVMTAREEGLFRKDLPLFQKLVASYSFLTTDVVEDAAPLDYAIPPDILKMAQKESKTKEGELYDREFGEALGQQLAGFMKECASGKEAFGWHRVVLALEKDGTATHIYAEKHDSVNDCLGPRLQGEKFPRPPGAPFYYLFELNVRK